MTSQEIIQRLKEGNQRFQNDGMERKNQDQNRREQLTDGQDPFAIVLSCADSRVVPELAFDTGIGELFILRVAGNIANTTTIASIEYAVANLSNAKVIVVLGHESCGAVTAAINGGDNGYNLNQLVSHITPAISALGDGAPVNQVVKENAKLNAKELVNRSAIIRGAVDQGAVEVVAAYYNLENGQIDFLD